MCLLIHEAPLEKSCENESNPVAGVAPCEFVDLGEPDEWKSAEYDDSGWTATTVHTATAVDPKDDYNNISWDDAAEFIWGPDLETNNTLLYRVTIIGKQSIAGFWQCSGRFGRICSVVLQHIKPEVQHELLEKFMQQVKLIEPKKVLRDLL